MKSSTDRIVKVLLERFPASKGSPVKAWESLLKSMRMTALSERALRYLAFQYGVSKDTIKTGDLVARKPQ